MTAARPAIPVPLRLQVLLVCVLLGVYLLILLPAPESADGNALAAVAASWLRSGSPDMNAIAASDALIPSEIGQIGSEGSDGATYAKKGITPSLFLMPLVALSDALPWLATRPTLMLFNALVTTATALLLLRFAAALGFRLRTALVVAFSFGVATFAFAYAKTLFGEPLAGLLLLVCVIAIHRGRGARYMLLAGAAVGLLIGINTIYAVFAPAIAFLILWRWRSLRAAIVFATPIAGTLVLIGAYNALRFGDPLNGGYHFGGGEGFIVPLGVGMYGLFLSPYRGLFWYSPLLLLALPGGIMLRRRDGWLFGAVVGLTLLQGLAFASWWSWHGGVVWAPRFLLPIVPLLCLALAPLVEAAWARRWLMLVFGGFFVLSALVASLGVLYSVFPYTDFLNAHYGMGDLSSIVTGLRDEVLYDPLLSPIVGHLALLRAGYPPEPGWLRTGDWAYLLIPGTLIAFGIGQAFISMRRAIRLTLLAVVLVVGLQLAVMRQPDSGEGQAFAETLQPPGTVVAATTAFGNALLDLKQRVSVITMSAPTTPDDADARRLWSYALRQRELLWFVTWFAPSDAMNWQEQELWQSAAFVAERPLLDHRALLFDLHLDPVEQTLGGWKFGQVVLASYGTEIRANGVQVVLRWSAAADAPKQARWFVHLLDAAGNVVAQQDRQPQGGYAPTEGWQAEQEVVDRLFFPLDSVPDGGWSLRVGWVDAAGAPVPVTDAANSTLVDPFITLKLAS